MGARLAFGRLFGLAQALMNSHGDTALRTAREGPSFLTGGRECLREMATQEV